MVKDPCAFNAGGVGSIPGGGIKIPHAMGHGKKKKCIKMLFTNFSPKASAYLTYPDPTSQYSNTLYPWIPTSVITLGLCMSSRAWRC